MTSFSLMGFSQGFINYENVASTTLKGKDGNKYGTGDLQRISGRFSLPLYRSLNESNQPTAWGLTLSASYNKMNNEEEAQELNPDEVLNTTLTISHIRPLSERWSLMASLGAGIYAMPDEIRWQSILANGAVFFIYRLHENLSIGLGGGLTNSYGAPILLPMGYLNWKTNGRYNVIIDIANAPKVQVTTQIGNAVKMELTAIEIDGMSAVINVDGKYKLYSSTMLRSGLTASLRVFDKASIYAGVGGVWKHNIATTSSPLVIHISISGKSIIVSNNLQLRSYVGSKNGIGLANLRNQYALHDEHLKIQKNEKEFIVEMPYIKKEYS